ncbi:SsgA family sporulation/cell division regulator [Streptomyces lancefieldiae]|uniref:SsgA family sporulation/cell division regulator n=1 Tax=Streptomyces lancefieldiae TaxID=3075520 RepID=A0ABU3B0Q5_9ACTN|nr:SsgA family sporulation/cell division regulator [Streptomyces sp. DSM 40712]MDT0616039.1 SsgA family sporulation/cell division regulator [Streptomyces sp. DSM 40712]
MTVRKDEPMDHLAATDEEFDALLEASSLGAPHVVAETGDIPATARRRMTQAVHRKRLSLGTPVGTRYPQADDGPDNNSLQAAPAAEASPAAPSRSVYDLFAGTLITGKSVMAGVLLGWLRSAPAGRSNRREGRAPKLWVQLPRDRHALWLATRESLNRGALLPCTTDDDSMTAHRSWHRTLAGTVAAASHNTLGETQVAFSCTLPSLQEVQPLAPEIAVPTGLPPCTLTWADEWRSWQRLRNLRQSADPWGKPGGALMCATATGLLLYTVPPTLVHIEHFTTDAYMAIGGGLLVPKAIAATKRASRVQESGTPGHGPRRPTRTDRAKVRRAVVDGTAELSAELPMLVHFDERESLALASSLHARLIYRASDPYAVEARFRVNGQGETVWIFARDLLKKGLEHKNGIGDVVVWPDADPQNEPRIFIRLSSPEGTALLSVADTGLRAFLEAASKLVAFGEEHPHLLPALNALETTMGELARPGRCE